MDVAGTPVDSEVDALWGGLGLGGTYAWADDKLFVLRRGAGEEPARRLRRQLRRSGTGRLPDQVVSGLVRIGAWEVELAYFYGLAKRPTGAFCFPHVNRFLGFSAQPATPGHAQGEPPTGGRPRRYRATR